MHESLKMIGVLFLTCGIAAASLSLVNMVTSEPIERGKQQQTEEGLREVFSAADAFEAAATAESAGGAQIWEALSQGKPVGYVFQIKALGYSGEITMMFGLDAEKKLTGLKVLNHTETPGLGAKITSPELFSGQFKNKGLEQLALKVDQPGTGAIDGITAATISSRAVTRAVHNALDAFLKGKEGE